MKSCLGWVGILLLVVLHGSSCHASSNTDLLQNTATQARRARASSGVTAAMLIAADTTYLAPPYRRAAAADASSYANVDRSTLIDHLTAATDEIEHNRMKNLEFEDVITDLYYRLNATQQQLQHYREIVERDESSHLPHADPNTEAFWFYVSGCVLLVVLGAIMSGLQVGYFSIDPMKLALLKMDPQSNPLDKQRAETLTPLLHRHHWLLVSLLIANACAMEALPIFLDALMPSYAAIIFSVTLVLIFCEVIPQSLCTKSPLAIGAAFAPFVQLLMFITAPLSYPLSRLLDSLLGEDGGSYFLLHKGELNALVDLHAESFGGHLQSDQIKLMKSALAYGERQCGEIMTPLSSVYMLEIHRKLDAETMHEIFNSGFSRIPCYDRNKPHFDNIVGLLMVKDLILLDPDDALPIQTLLNLYPRPLETVTPATTLKDVLEIFKTGRTHIAIVHYVVDGSNNNSNIPAAQTIAAGNESKSLAASTSLSSIAVTVDAATEAATAPTAAATTDIHYVNAGIITLEDVIEAILETEISDESDLDEFNSSIAANNSSSSNNSNSNSRTTLAKYLRSQQQKTRLSPAEASAVYYNLINNVSLFQQPLKQLSDNGLKRVIADSQVVDAVIDHTHHHQHTHSHSNSSIDLQQQLLYNNGSGSSSSSDAYQNEMYSGGSYGTMSNSSQHHHSSSITGTSLVHHSNGSSLSYREQLEHTDILEGGKSLYQRGVANDFMTLILDGFVELRAGEEQFVSEARRWNVIGSTALKCHADELAATVSVEQLHAYVPDFSAVLVVTSRLLRISRRRYIDEIRKELNLEPIRDEQKRIEEEEQEKAADTAAAAHHVLQQQQQIEHDIEEQRQPTLSSTASAAAVVTRPNSGKQVQLKSSHHVIINVTDNSHGTATAAATALLEPMTTGEQALKHRRMATQQLHRNVAHLGDNSSISSNNHALPLHSSSRSRHSVQPEATNKSSLPASITMQTLAAAINSNSNSSSPPTRIALPHSSTELLLTVANQSRGESSPLLKQSNSSSNSNHSHDQPTAATKNFTTLLSDLGKRPK